MFDESELHSLTTTQGRAVPVNVSPNRGQDVDLQRKVGDAWIGVSRVKADTGNADGQVRVTVPTRPGLSRYRVVVRPSTWSTQTISASFTMHQTDVDKHRTYLIKARGYMSRFCPHNPIHIDTKHVLGDGNWGVVGWAQSSNMWAVDGSSGRISTRIDLRSGLPLAQLRHVALHECAHAVQNRALVEQRQEIEEARASTLWPRVGGEGQADCMAYYLTKNADWMGYVGGCTTTQLANAKRMWLDYGSKYQAHPYTWGDADELFAAGTGDLVTEVEGHAARFAAASAPTT